MRFERLILCRLLLLGCLVAPVEAAIDAEDDALARLLDRPGLLPHHVMMPLDASDPIWMPGEGSHPLGVFGAHLDSHEHRHRTGPRTTVGLATTATPWGRPADVLGLSLTVDDPAKHVLDEVDLRAGAVTAFYGWRITSDVVLQPGIVWTSDRDDPADRITALLALRIEF